MRKCLDAKIFSSNTRIKSSKLQQTDYSFIFINIHKVILMNKFLFVKSYFYNRIIIIYQIIYIQKVHDIFVYNFINILIII